MPDILFDPVARLISLRRQTDRRTVIALAGYPGSGKSTIAEFWAGEVDRRIGEGAMLVLGMDGFHLSKAELRAMDNPTEAFARRGAPFTFNPEGLSGKLKELRDAAAEKAVGWPGFEHGVGDPVDDAIIVPSDCRLVLVEGIYTLYRDDEWAELDGLFDEKWFLDTPLETAMDRIYKRHMSAWGMSDKEARQRADSNDRLNCAFISPGRDTADYLITD